ncbi:uncharacterized protein [Epargyreus clarus]|uniref:uncharacterized protein n=1 Tax=Epargyreus clarus TaxID=520877 RepID=UPI003C2BDDC5
MAQIEPMDIDAIESDFDNKENTFHHNNVLSRTPCTEKGYEELDVSELNMKLRYSVTPASSPMSKSLTGPCLDNRNCNPGDDYLNNTVGTENGSLTRSLNSTLTKTESVTKSKVLPLQTLSADPFVDSNRNSSMRRLIEPDNNVIISVNNNNDENLSLPSTSSSVTNTPEATTPTKDISKPEGSPIMRGLKSVLSMFRPSQSPIPPADDKTLKPDILSPVESQLPTSHSTESEVVTVLASTPVAANKQKDTSRRSSPLKESVVFNDDLERELQWKDETTIIFKQEKIPVHKLFFQNPITPEVKNTGEHLNNTVEYMDISCNESVMADRTMADIEPSVPVKIDGALAVESDNEFLDCETTFTKNESLTSDYKETEMANKTEVINNVTVDLLKTTEIKEITESESRNVANTIENMKTEGISEEISEQSVTDIIARSLVENSSIIIEATMGMLKSETNNQAISNDEQSTFLAREQNVNLQSETPVTSPEQPVELTTDGKIIDNNEKIINVINTDASAADNKIDDLNMDRTFECKESSNEIKIMSTELDSESIIGNVGNLPDVCTVKLNDTEYSKVILSEQSIELKDNVVSDIVDNDRDINVKNTIYNSVSPDMVIKEEIHDPNNSLESHEMQQTPNNLDTTQVLQHEANPDLLKTNSANPVIVDSEISIDDKNLSGIVHNSIIHLSSTVENLPVTDTMNIENVISTKITESGLHIEPNVLNIDVDRNQVNNTKFNATNHENIEDTTEVNKENLNINTNGSLEFQLNVTQNSHIESNITISNVVLRDNDRELSELSIGNDMMIRKSPSEIPLPDEDDIEQAFTEPNNVCADPGIAQDVTFEVCDSNMTVDLESTNKSAADITMAMDDIGNVAQSLKTEVDDSRPINITIEHNIEHNITIEHNIENAEDMAIKDLQLNDSQICNTVAHFDTNLHGIKTESCSDEISYTHTENLAHSDIDSKIATSNIHVENTFDNKCQEGFEANIDGQDTKNIENSCDTTKILTDNEDFKEKVLCDAEVISILKEDSVGEGLLNTIKSDCVNSIDKFEDVTQVKIDDIVHQEKELQEVDEEIITSANNSPYVSVTDLALDTELNKEPLENIENPFEAKTKICSSPPISPKIVSKGYNFNFDDIDDPFATKTKIRMSPTPDSPSQTSNIFEKEVKKLEEIPKKVNNRRKSQPERKKPAQKKNFNRTFNNQLPTKETVSEINTHRQAISTPTEAILPSEVLNKIPATSIMQDISEVKIENPIISAEEVKKENITNDIKSTSQEEVKKENDDENICEIAPVEQTSTTRKEEMNQIDEEMKCAEQTGVVINEKSTSSSEQYFSLGTSSGESTTIMNRSKNVFNLPEIDDINFNPFATNSKMRMSPPPSQNSTYVAEEPKSTINTTTTDTKESDLTFDKITTKDSSSNVSNTTCSSNNTNDKDTTVREVLTEDEDTIEGPFLEAEDLKLLEKVTDIDVASDMMNFDEIPSQEKDENLENGELFIDADAFEFLLNQNKSSTVLDSGKESLFLKFDPLFAKRVSSDGVLAALSKVQKRQSTPKKLTKPTQKDFTHIDKPVAGPSTEKDNYVPVEEYNEDLSSTMTKPMMVVNPAVSSIVSPRRSATPPKLNRRSLTFTSPAMAVIDRLLSLSGNSSHLDNNTSIPLVSREHSETDLAITQLRELLAEKEIHVHNLRSETKELKDRLAALEAQVRNLETESTERLTKINDLNERLSEKTKINKSMAIVVEEYERTIASLIAETEQDKRRNAEERMRLIKDRDEQTAHLTSMEVSFSDLHSKYEKSKQIILSCKANEDAYKKSIKEFEENFTKMQNNYELLKQHATSKLNHANQELEKMNRAHEAEVLKLNAMIKRKDLHITSLEETLTQKTKANEELTAICDELINKVG